MTTKLEIKEPPTCAHCGVSMDHWGMWGQGTDAVRLCYECCAARELADMHSNGRAVLYYTATEESPEQVGSRKEYGTVGNWTGELSYRVMRMKVGGHNIAGRRYDVWFRVPLAGWWGWEEWHGTTYGDNTQLCHCRRITGGRS